MYWIFGISREAREVRDNTGNISKMVEEIEEQNGIHYVKIVSRE